jgi:predicted DNA-binding antitoxin AbrB/MazE fold protein
MKPYRVVVIREGERSEVVESRIVRARGTCEAIVRVLDKMIRGKREEDVVRVTGRPARPEEVRCLKEGDSDVELDRR